MESDGLMNILEPPGIAPTSIQCYKSLRGHGPLSLKLPISETKTRPELASWLPTHSDLVSDSEKPSSQHGELPPSFLTDARS